MANYVVAGAAGRVGSIVAAELLARGETVTVIVRDEARGRAWADRGARVANGSLDEAAFVRDTVRGAAGFFTILPENVPPDDFHGARRRMADAIASGVRDSGVAHVVLLSAIAAILPDENGPAKDLHYCERQLTGAAQRLTVLRACYLQDNVAGVMAAAQHAGIYPSFLTSADAPIPMIATGDVGRFAAQALLDPPPAGEIVDLLGPEYSGRQVAHALGIALGKDVQVVDVPPAQQSDMLAQAGLPRPLADAVAEMFAAFNAGRITPQGNRGLRGTTTIDRVIAHYLQRQTAGASA